MSATRIDWQKLLLIYVGTIVFPLLIGLLAEVLFDASFSLILMAGLIAIPIAMFFVIRTAVAEIERVVEIVAPELPEQTDEDWDGQSTK